MPLGPPNANVKTHVWYFVTEITHWVVSESGHSLWEQVPSVLVPRVSAYQNIKEFILTKHHSLSLSSYSLWHKLPDSQLGTHAGVFFKDSTKTSMNIYEPQELLNIDWQSWVYWIWKAEIEVAYRYVLV